VTAGLGAHVGAAGGGRYGRPRSAAVGVGLRRDARNCEVGRFEAGNLGEVCAPVQHLTPHELEVRGYVRRGASASFQVTATTVGSGPVPRGAATATGRTRTRTLTRTWARTRTRTVDDA